MARFKIQLSLLVLASVCFLGNTQSTFFQIGSPWTWKCEASNQISKTKECVRVEASQDSAGVSEAACRLTCYDGSLIWPKPTGPTTLSGKLASFAAGNVAFIKLVVVSSESDQASEMLEEAKAIFLNYITQLEGSALNGSARTCSSSSKQCGFIPVAAEEHRINIEVVIKTDTSILTTTTDEGYTLDIQTVGETTTVYVTAQTYFGARHGLETLSQLIAWDDLGNSLVMINEVHVEDAPVFPHRGLSLDTSRSYISIPQLKRIIDGLSYDKMNVLHWHITDSHSFPIVSNREPLMAIYGAYSARHVYRPEEVRELVHYAMVRGVKIVPEFDTPAHVGAGWQWGPQYGMGDLALCFDKQPWEQYCAEPPCGILNPVNNNTYKVLSNIYSDYADLFKSDIFHSGGDEVNMRCWNETEEIVEWMMKQNWDQSVTSFLKLWSHFQEKNAALIDDAFDKSMQLQYWTSDLTNDGHAPSYLDPKRYVIQFWDSWNDPDIKTLYQQGYRLIMSNADALYLDCGYGAWVGMGSNNWCSPYIGWQKMYDNSPRKIIENFNISYDATRFLGGEAAMWTEQTQGRALETKIWPRLSAVAERLWTDPQSSWRLAENRFLTQRERIAERGIAADLHQPQWCMQNGASCYL